MDEIQLERRLTLIESAQTTAALLAATHHTTVIAAVTKVEVRVETQNGRVGKLETWKTQQGTAMTIAIAAGPFVFWALSKWA